MNGNQGNRKSRAKGDDSSEGAGWEVVYTGFVLILLCFFVMLSSFASFEESKVARFVSSFADALNISILPGGLKFEPANEVLNASPDMVEKDSELADLLKDFRAFISSAKLDKDITFSSSPEGLRIRLADTVMFDLGTADISSEAIPLLEELASIISKTSQGVAIEGHTDNLPIHSARFPSNWELSTARAVNVLRYFVEKKHIAPQRLAAVGFGEFQPIFPNDSPENRARNRRVEIVFLKEPSAS